MFQGLELFRDYLQLTQSYMIIILYHNDTLFMQKAITAHEHINIYSLQTCRIASYTDIMLLSYSYFLTYYAHSINGRGALYINLKNICIHIQMNCSRQSRIHCIYNEIKPDQ